MMIMLMNFKADWKEIDKTLKSLKDEHNNHVTTLNLISDDISPELLNKYTKSFLPFNLIASCIYKPFFSHIKKIKK